MKHLKVLFFLLILLTNCDDTTNRPFSSGQVSFSLAPSLREGGRIKETATPAYVLLSIKSNSGQIYNNKKLALYNFGGEYVSESLELAVGVYQLTQFMILDSQDKIIYATPIEDSEFSLYVDDPLPIEFEISENVTTQMVPQVLAVAESNTPQDFGYVSFGFNLITVKKLKKAEIRDAKDAVLSYTEYAYNNANQLTKEEIYYRVEEKDFLSRTITYEYGYSGLKKITRSIVDGSVAQYLYHADLQNRIEKVELFSDGLLQNIWKSNYSGDTVRIVPFGADGKGGSLVHEFIYSDKNIARYSKYNNGNEVYCISYEYLTQTKNPLYHNFPLYTVGFPNLGDYFTLAGVHNSKNLTKSMAGCNLESTLFSYQIDNDGYPVKMPSGKNTIHLTYY